MRGFGFGGNGGFWGGDDWGDWRVRGGKEVGGGVDWGMKAKWLI